MKNKFQIAMTLAVILAMAFTSLVLADYVVNNIDNTIDAVKETRTISVGGSTVVGFFIKPNNSDPNDVNGCNATGGTPATLNLNIPANVTASASSLIFTACDTTQNVTFSSNTAATYTISVANVTGGKAGSAWSTDEAKFDLIVNGPTDNTGPVITPTIVGTLGSNGWYVSNVSVSWSVVDNESAISASSGCGPTTISADTAGTTLTCSATSGGGTSSQSVTIKRDATKPTISAAISAGTLGLNSWYTSNVTVQFTCNDAGSGILAGACPADQVLSTEGAAVSSTAQTVTDAAGNTSNPSNVITVKIDKTGPSAVLSPSGTAGANGWFTGDVTITTSGSDAVSDNVTCTAPQSQTTETAGAVFNGSCTNGAGLSTNAAPLTVKLDKTGPSASLAVTAGTAGANGWYTSDVTVSTTGSDLISGPVTCTVDQFQTTETTGQTFNGSCTNDAGLITNAAPLTVKLDETGPSAVLSASGTAGANGWFVGDVTITASGSDAVSDNVTCTPNQSQTAETAGAVFNGSCTNGAGLTTNAAPLTVKLDKTGPSASLSASGTVGNNGWYTSDVTIQTTGSDDISSPVDCTDDQTQTSDTLGQIFNGSCTNDAGLSTNAAPLTIKRDATAPTVTVTPDAGPDHNGWYNNSVDFTTAGTDATSDIESCTDLQTYSGPDGSNLTVNGSCTDNAGNIGNGVSDAFNYDATAPHDVTVVADRGPDSNGWYNHAFTATWSGTDDTSDIDSCTSSNYSGPDTNAGSLSGTCTDNAGNTSGSIAFTFKYDATKPTIVAAISAGTTGLNGWYVSNVTVHFTCADNLSGIAAACPADQILSAEGTGISSTAQTTVDVAGNSSNASNVVSVNIDKTKPVITITTPPSGASYLLNQAVASNYGCSDVTSGIATCAGPVASGINIYTASTGSHSFTVNASDAAGNTNSATNNYSVAFKICALYDQTKAHKLGSTVPLKLQLCDVNGVNVSSATIIVKATNVTKVDNTAGPLDDSGAANSPDMNFRYDATLGGTGGYIFNLSTKGLSSGTWKVAFTINGASGTSYFVTFDVK